VHSDIYCRAQAQAAQGERSPQQPLTNNELTIRANADADKHNRLCDIFSQHMSRLDAALRRIEALELEVARLKGASAVYGVPPNASSAYAQAIDRKLENIRQSTKLVFDANGSPLPDEGT
jgi:DNA-binding MurR/RpiR family transcriptional regulator